MLKALRDMALSTRLLLLPSLFVAAMLICAAAAQATLSEAKVHGPYYTRVVEQKDLIADVLPPPLYVVETYLTALSARSAASPLERARLAEQVRVQREAYEERLANWRARLPKGALRDALLERSRRPAQAFFDALERDYMPAVLAGEGARADAIQSSRLTPLYAEHRAAIDRVVALATRASSDTEADVRTIIAQAGQRDLWLAALLISVVVAVSLWLRKAALDGAAREAEAAARLRETLGAIAACGEVLTRSAQALSGIGEQLSAHAESTSQGSQGASASSDQVSNTLQTVAAGAEEYSASIREISRHAQDAATVAGTAVDATGAAQETVASLGTRSAEVGDVVAQINAIAQQTNLLALNAAIEAARAGEAGKGFAVVAHDVKELARATSQATRDIGRKILAMQGEAQRAVGVLADIHGIVNRINDHQQTIASAVEEQTATTSEISRSVSEGARGTREIAAVLGGVAHTADATRDAAVRARATADDLVRMGRELNALVARCAGAPSERGADETLDESGVRDRRSLGHAGRRRAA